MSISTIVYSPPAAVGAVVEAAKQPNDSGSGIYATCWLLSYIRGRGHGGSGGAGGGGRKLNGQNNMPSFRITLAMYEKEERKPFRQLIIS